MAFDTNDLSPHEHHVVERTREGEVADFSALTGGDGAKPVVRAGFLRKLLLRMDPAWPVQAPGVRIKGARIEGALDLSDCAGGAGLPALALVECEIPEPIDISHTRLARFSINGSRLRKVIASTTVVDGEFSFDNASPLALDGVETLCLLLRAARVGGDLRGIGAHLAHDEDPTVLNLQSAHVGGNVLLRDGFRARGCLWLFGVEVGGALSINGGSIVNQIGDDAQQQALVVADARIGGGVFLQGGFKAEGSVNMSGIRVGGGISLHESALKNDGHTALDLAGAQVRGDIGVSGKILGIIKLHSATIHGNLMLSEIEVTPSSRAEANLAIAAPALRVSGTTWLDGANIKGEVYLADARIDGALMFGGGRFINGGGQAICATNLRVGGNLSIRIEELTSTPFGQKTLIEGNAIFERARIDGALVWQNLELRGKGPNNTCATFSFADASIAGPIEARALTTQQDAHIDASGATCAALDDDVKTGWGADSARLNLEGFAYSRIDSADEKWAPRLRWLKRARGDDGRYSPQPFAQAAQVYARAGKREAARRILLAQHDLRAVAGSQGPITWLLSTLYGLLSGYALAPIRIVRALALYLAVGVLGVLAMNAQGALVTPEGRQCNGAIEPAIYAIDVALPLIDLGQQSACAPGRTARADLSPGVALNPDSDWRLFEGLALWRWAHALYAIFGAILAALAVLTFSGVMKPRDN